MSSDRRHAGSVARGAVAMAALVSAGIFVVQALAGTPAVTQIVEPAAAGAPVNPADVHMVAEFADEASHVCSDWEIRLAQTNELAWEAPCAKGQLKVHIHLGDGTFLNSHAGRQELKSSTEYVLLVRSRDDVGGEVSATATRAFTTREPGPAGDEATAWKVRSGYAVEVFADDLQLPVDIAMVPDPGSHPGDPLMYVTELYGAIKVITRDGTVHDYATGLLNFNPTGNFPGSGEIGVAGVVVEPVSGDLFVSLVYEDMDDPSVPKPHYPRVIRLHSDERGLSATAQTTVLDMPGEVQDSSHQVSNLTIAGDGELLVHNGDGILQAKLAQDLDYFRGKILRMTFDGEPVLTNPFYTDDGESTARDYVYAYGLRNPFGGATRLTDGAHFMVENGPFVDRLAKVVGGENYQWPQDLTMSHMAAYKWDPSHAPVSIEFVEAGRFGGSGFPAAAMGHAFVTESGATWASGPQELGKRIVEFGLDGLGNVTSGPTTLVEYSGTGKATAVGLAAGEDGIYFTDLYKDTGLATPIDRGANVLRVRYCGDACPVRSEASASPSSSAPSDAADGVPPVVRRFLLQRRAFAVGGARSVHKSPAQRGTVFLYALSEPASVAIRVRRKGELTPLAELRAPGRAGGNRRFFSGVLRGRPLPAGRYVATLRARDAAGNLSRSYSRPFRVLDP